MEKSVVQYIGNDSHSDVMVYKFDNTAEDQREAQEILAEGKAPILPRGDTIGLTYVLPASLPMYYYSPYENKKFRKDG